jgi:hypothetical protein
LDREQGTEEVGHHDSPCLGYLDGHHRSDSRQAGAAASRQSHSIFQRGATRCRYLAYLFTAIYSFGLGPVPFTLSAELFPLEERMVGMSVAVALNFLGAGCLTLLVPPLTSDPAVLLGPFAVLNFVGFIFVWIFVREVAKERPVATQQAGADDGDAKQEKSMEPLTLEGVFKVFEPEILEHIEFRWRRLIGWENKVTDSFIEFYEAKKQRGRNGKTNT